MSARRLVVFVEGKGDVRAVPTIVKRALTAAGGHDALYVDPDPFRVTGLGMLVKDGCVNWHRWLAEAARTRRDLGAVMLVLDGDVPGVPPGWKTYVDRHGSTGFCVSRAAAALGEEARAARGGEAFSVAVVFAVKEFETWLLAGIESLRGCPLSDGRGAVPKSAAAPEIELEEKRDAKRLLRHQIPHYSESLDQAVLATHVDLEAVERRCRSFRRLTSAVKLLIATTRAGQQCISPSE